MAPMPHPPLPAPAPARAATPIGRGSAHVHDADADARLYAALRARDARFDGRLFVGVTSTGVYCRPVCRVRTPLLRNCRFFGNAASAERAGFRPCLRCRPELAPGLAFVDSSRSLALTAARLISQAVLEGRDVALPAIAGRLGVTDRHLRRIFAAEHGVSPVDYLTTQRLLHAKQLLTDTTLPVTQVALASGFASLRRFNAAFAERYRMSPTALRRARVGGDSHDDAHGDAHGDAPGDAPGEAPADAPGDARGTARCEPRAAAPAALTVRLGYRPPFDIAGLLRFFARRAIAGVEVVDEAALTLRRTIAWTQGGRRVAGWVGCRFRPERHEVEVEVAPSLVSMLGALLQRLRQGLDLDADPALVDPLLAALPGAPVAGIRVPGAMDGFEAAVRVVLGQQVTVAAARTLGARLVAALGEPITTPHAGLSLLFPDALRVAGADPAQIGRLGIVRQRVRALQALATEVVAGRIELHPAAPLAPTLDALRALPGIGEWTVQLIALRALGWPDAFPATDIGVLEALAPRLGGRDAKAAEAASQAWRPWRGYAVMRLWQSLET
jgi:AraC family transcriptional regulator of adaptative response / DNA-3-methyladenine glycosylase II